MLFASEKQSLESATTLYDSLIVKIFKKDLLANAKLVLQQASPTTSLRYRANNGSATLAHAKYEANLFPLVKTRGVTDRSPRMLLC